MKKLLSIAFLTVSFAQPALCMQNNNNNNEFKKIVVSPEQQKEMIKQLLNAISENNIDRFTSLLEQGVNVNTYEAHGYTPLYYACYKKRLEMVQALLNYKADVNTPNKDGTTPLHGTCMSQGEHPEIAQLLLNNNADVNAQNKLGKTPLHGACVWGYLETVKLLLNNKANANAQDKSGRTPLYEACSPKHLEIAQLLLNNNANPNARDKSGRTLLHEACYYLDSLKTVKLLLKSCIKPTIDWNQKRILFIGNCKEEPQNCHFAKLPTEMIQYIFSFCPETKQNIAQLKQLIEYRDVDGENAFGVAFNEINYTDQEVLLILNPQSWADDETAKKTYTNLLELVAEQCAYCKKKPNQKAPLKVCSGCKTTKYCNADCQKNHWKQHKPNCKK